MYKLMIVDDDPWVLDWMKNRIDWRQYGVCKVMEAVNGQQAVHMVNEEQPDIIITDIKMDRMDGIELLSWVREKYQDIRVILLSGYHEFEYARSALKKGAVDYLLKPVEDLEITSLIKRTLKEIQNEREIREREQKTMEHLEKSVPLLKEKFIKELLSGNVTESALLMNELTERNICIDFSTYYILVIEMDKMHSNKQCTASVMDTDAKGIVQKVGNAFLSRLGTSIGFYENDQFVIKYCTVSPNSVKDIAFICGDISQKTGYTVSMGISKLKKDIHLAREAYIEAYEALKMKFYLGTNRIIRAEETGGLSKEIIFDASKRAILKNYIDLGNFERAKEFLKGVFSEVAEKKTSFDILQLICLRMISVLNDSLEKAGFSHKTLQANGFDVNIKIEDFETVEELKEWFLSLISKAINCINGKSGRRSRKMIDDAIQFIYDHLREEVSLDTMAKKLYMNPAYLSRLFKDEVGITFTHFLMKARIEKAKELLTGSYLKIYEISDQVGYKNEKYFSRIFKDFEGITPNEYRDRTIKTTYPIK